MTPAAILAELAAQGVTVTVAAGDLKLRSRHPLLPDLVAALRLNKPAILALLTAQNSDTGSVDNSTTAQNSGDGLPDLLRRHAFRQHPVKTSKSRPDITTGGSQAGFLASAYRTGPYAVTAVGPDHLQVLPGAQDSAVDGAAEMHKGVWRKRVANTRCRQVNDISAAREEHNIRGDRIVLRFGHGLPSMATQPDRCDGHWGELFRCRGSRSRIGKLRRLRRCVEYGSRVDVRQADESLSEELSFIREQAALGYFLGNSEVIELRRLDIIAVNRTLQSKPAGHVAQSQIHCLWVRPCRGLGRQHTRQTEQQQYGNGGQSLHVADLSVCDDEAGAAGLGDACVPAAHDRRAAAKRAPHGVTSLSLLDTAELVTAQHSPVGNGVLAPDWQGQGQVRGAGLAAADALEAHGDHLSQDYARMRQCSHERKAP